MREAVVAEVIAERAFGQQPLGIDRAGDAEVGVGVDRQLAGAADHPHAPAAERAGEASSLIPSGSGITAATAIAGGPPTKTFTRNGSPARIAAA